MIFGVLSLVFALSIGMSYYEVRHAVQLSAGERLSSLSRVLSSVIQTNSGGRINSMRAVAADTAIIKAMRTPDRAPSRAALEAMRPITTRADSLTPPQLWNPEGVPIGAVQLE